jgi:hypothetical protein
VKSDGGYYGKKPGKFPVVIAVTGKDNVEYPVTATVGQGSGPVIAFTEYPLVLKQSATSHILTDDELKDKMSVQDPEEGDLLAAPTTTGGVGTKATPVGLNNIDSHNIGVYQVSYTARDSHGNAVTRTRAIVITDGRYIIEVTDDDDDTNDAIIGARNYLIKARSVNGTEQQAASWSHAEAYDGDGDEKDVTWGEDAPAGYIAWTGASSTKPGAYDITWYIKDLPAVSKKIKATVVNADEVFPGGKNDQYGIAANNFLRTVAQATDMVADADTADDKLIDAAGAKVYKLVDDTYPDKSVYIQSRGGKSTGPFRGEKNTYEIQYIIDGMSLTHGVTIKGVVSDGALPILEVSTPDEVALGGVYDIGAAGRYMLGVKATDPDGDKNGSTDPKDHTATTITKDVKYGTLSGPEDAKVFTEGTPVVTTKAGVYGVDYHVTDSDGNKADAHRAVVVNDGSYIVGTSNILKANSFVTKADSVTSDAALIRQELRMKSGATAINGSTGNPFDLNNNNVTNTGGYSRKAGEYSVTITAPDPTEADENHTISKGITAKVVDADEIDHGPKPANPEDATRYYVYGNHISLTKSQAEDILDEADAAAKDAAMLTALGAHALVVSPGGVITTAAAVMDDYGTFSSANGKYGVTVKDAGSNASVRLYVTVSQGNGPAIAATPIPLIIETVSAPGSLTDDQIFGGVTVLDVEDTSGAAIAWNKLPVSGPQVSIVDGTPQIKAHEKSVTKVTYSYTDSDINPSDVSRAIVVNDGRYVIDKGYIIEANSFIVGKREAASVKDDPNQQIIEKSEAKAWKIDGTPADVQVISTSGYGTDDAVSYNILIGVDGGDLTKQIQAKVIDDRDPSEGKGQDAYNGDRYSIMADNFRINVTDATLWQGEKDEAYGAQFLTRANAVSYLRASSMQTTLIESGTPKLESVIKLDESGDPTGVNFNDPGLALAEGDKFIATFLVDQEKDTKVGILVLVSNATPPVLSVPASKQVPVASAGAVFPMGNPDSDEPSYYQGVRVSDSEDHPAISYTAVTYAGIVDVTTEGAYDVDYSVTDSDHNTTTAAGMVLVGPFKVIDGYAIMAHDFFKQVGEVTDKEQDVITAARAYAIDMRQYLEDGEDKVPNPQYRKRVPVRVKSDGGYYGKKPGKFPVVIAVTGKDNVEYPVTASVGQGSGPVIAFTEYPLVLKQSETSKLLTDDELKDKMIVQDPEDKDLLANPAPAGTSVTCVIRQGGESGSRVANIDTQNIGVYKVTYKAKDSHGNTATRTRAIVVTDERYIIDVTDDGDDTNDLIIGARDFVIAKEHVDGSETQVKGRSYAEAFDGDGDAKTVTWTGAPAKYVAKAPVADYDFTWQVAGFSQTKSIVGHVTDATVVDPGTKDSKYALIASDFKRNIAGATAMLTSNNTISKELITAARADVVTLVSSEASAAVATVGVVSNGDAITGPFSAVQNTYSIRFGLVGHDANEFKAIINGVVSNGEAPVLIAPTPLEVWIGDAGDMPKTAIGEAAWNGSGNKYGVTANDYEDETLSAADVTITAGSDTVDTAKPGVYKLAYTVTDSDGNTVTVKRAVVVNDGSYKVGKSRILKANSFEINKDAVVASPEVMKNSHLKSLSGVTL